MFCPECNWKGNCVIVTENTDCLEIDPKSVCLPEGRTITAFNLCKFNGKTVNFEESIPCLDDLDFSFLAKYGISVKGTSSLKTNIRSKKEVQDKPVKIEINHKLDM